MVDGCQSPRPKSFYFSPSTSVNKISSYAIKKFTNINFALIFILPFMFAFLTIVLFQVHYAHPRICAIPRVIPVDNSSSSNKLGNLFDFSYLSGWKFRLNDSFSGPKICITTTTSTGLVDILPWIFYHKVVGITNFFLYVEGEAASDNVCEVLERIPGVKIIPRTREFEEQQANSRIWNETWLADSFHKPCNHALFVKQNLNMESAIAMAREAGMEWILHLDTDELLHPAGSPDYSMKKLLANVPSDVDAVVFHNYESAIEHDDIIEPFSEVSLFKRNKANLPMNNSDFTLLVSKEAIRPDNPSYFLAYANGKSAARIEDHLRPNGAHRWYNYMRTPKEMLINEAVVLHYPYARLSDLAFRRDRCKCKPTREDVKRCFFLKFDRVAFIIASTTTEEEMLRWYQEHLVWSDETIKQRLLNYGILTRIYTPMIIIEQLTRSKDYVSIIDSANSITSSKSARIMPL